MGGFPSKPDVPSAPNVDPGVAQRAAVSNNQAALPGLEDLASGVNTFNTAQRRSMVDANIPGYENLTGGASGLLSNWLGGQISPDVASQVSRAAGARAYAGGYGGSGMADNLQARDLGLTSLDLQRAGMSALPGYLNTINNIAVPRQFDPTTEFLSPQEQIAASQWNESNRYSRDWLQNQLNSIPDPYTAAISGDLGQMADTVGSMIPYFGSFYAMSGQGSPAAANSTGAGMGGGWLDQLFGGMGGGGGGGVSAMGLI